MQGRLRFLYETEHPTAHRFRYALLTFDMITILFIVATSFADRTLLLEAIDLDAVHCKACGVILNLPDKGMSL